MVDTALGAYLLFAVQQFPSVALVGSDVFPYRLDWQMLTGVLRVFTHDDYLVIRVSLSDRVFRHYSDAHAVVTSGLNINFKTYPSSPSFITTARQFQVVPESCHCSFCAIMRAFCQDGTVIEKARGVPARKVGYEGSKWRELYTCIGLGT